MREPTLQTTALRYAAGDLLPEEITAFEIRLATDQDARDALAEAVRLSAQAIGQKPPTPHASCRAALRERLNMRTQRGGPVAWVMLGAAAVAACTIIGLALADRAEPDTTLVPVATAPVDLSTLPTTDSYSISDAAPPMPEPHAPVIADHPNAAGCDDDPARSVAEIWADLSNHENVEKAHEDEMRWRSRVRDLSHPRVLDAMKAAPADVPEP